MYVLSQGDILERESDPKCKFHSDDTPRRIVPLSERHGGSLRQTLVNFLNAIDYSFTSYPEFKDLELALRNKILSFGITLRPGWEKVLRTSCTLVGMEYPKHPIEIQVSIAVCNPHILLPLYRGGIDYFSCILDSYVVWSHYG